MPRRTVERLLPVNFSDSFALAFFLGSVIVTFIFEITTVVPYVHSSYYWRYFHSFMGSFIMHNILGNLWFSLAKDTSTKSVILPARLSPGWRLCTACEANAPPRAHHCATCDRCILKRDHHCIFTGKCIGYRNFRYFWALAFWVAVGSFYASVLNAFFIWDFIGGFTFVNVFKHTFPMLFWLLGKLPLKIASWTMICLINFCGSLFAGGLFFYHSSMMAVNQTSYEHSRNITTYNLGSWKVNTKEALGRNWTAVLFSPYIHSRLLRDGINFPSLEEYRLTDSKSK